MLKLIENKLCSRKPKIMLFFPSQDELDCITSDGQILGKIRFDTSLEKHIFTLGEASLELTSEQQEKINQRLAGLDVGQFTMPTQDDD